MARLTSKEEKSVQIGIDIGSYAVKAAAILHSGERRKLIGFSIKPVKDNIISAIRDAHAELGLRRRKVVTSIAGQAVIVRYAELPSMTDEELKGATQFEAEKVIPYKIDDVVLDSAKMEDLSDNRMRVVIVAAKKDLIDTHIKIITQAELEPLILDVDSFALMNSFVSSGADKESVCGLLNIGARATNLNIVKGDISYLSRDIDIGANSITSALSSSLSLSEAEAEKLKDEKLSKISESAPDDAGELKAAADTMLSQLADELRLSFDFYENHYAGNVAKAYISGGISGMGYVSSFLNENLGRAVSAWDALANIEVGEKIDRKSLEGVKSQLAVAIGLALRRAE